MKAVGSSHFIYGMTVNPSFIMRVPPPGSVEIGENTRTIAVVDTFGFAIAKLRAKRTGAGRNDRTIAEDGKMI
jgi:hypothetical protein